MLIAKGIKRKYNKMFPLPYQTLTPLNQKFKPLDITDLNGIDFTKSVINELHVVKILNRCSEHGTTPYRTRAILVKVLTSDRTFLVASDKKTWSVIRNDIIVISAITSWHCFRLKETSIYHLDFDFL
ncbi:hypothetical protein SK128_011819 [Halocaridina rubra]|uniref:Uncharacterized protein n=1 Tax=Halocaridina rubra TaxID=373956 RepID=A0AAN9AF08_HALRR